MANKMPNDNAKLARFEKAVFSEVQGKAAEILSEVDSYKEEKLGGIEEAEQRRASDLIQRKSADIRGEFARKITREKLNAHQNLLLRRQELTDGLFQEAARQIQEWTKTPDYRKMLLTLLERHKDLLSDGVRVLARAEDAGEIPSIAAEISSDFKGALVEATKDIRLGGLIFISESRRLYLDESLDGRLKEAEEQFYLSGKANLDSGEGGEAHG